MKISWRFLIIVLAVMSLAAAACGSDDGPASAPSGDDVGDSASLPPNDGDAPPAPAAGTCLEGEPDCQDVGVTPPVDDLPPPSSDGEGPSGVAVVLLGDVAGVSGAVAVEGFLVDDGTEARLCEALAESFPPQCGGASLVVVGWEPYVDPDSLSTNQGVTWSDWTRLTGTVTDGVLVVG